jgi:ubiquitin
LKVKSKKRERSQNSGVRSRKLGELPDSVFCTSACCLLPSEADNW